MFQKARAMSREEDAILSQAPQNHRLRLSRSSHKVYTWNPGECICMSCVWSYPFLLGCCGWWYQVLFVTGSLLTHFHLQHAICLVIYPIEVCFGFDVMQVCAGTIGIPKRTEEKNEWGWKLATILHLHWWEICWYTLSLLLVRLLLCQPKNTSQHQTCSLGCQIL